MKNHLMVLLLLAVLLMPSLALAQAVSPSPESVTVTGTRDRQVLDNFVQSFAAPTRTIGKLARWENDVCPRTTGLRPTATKFVTKRVREIAALAGAPVDSRASCRPNIEILFSSHPQILLNNIREKHPQFLGYSGNDDQTAKLSAVTRPIQAWYMTATEDLRGATLIDGLKPPADGPLYAQLAVTGNRTGDGLRATLYRVTIVVDPDKLVEYEIGSLADYIAMLALTQLNALDTCQQLPSIVNMLASGCERQANELTANDIAYLRGLYRMSPGMSLRSQKDEIAYQMEQRLEGRP